MINHPSDTSKKILLELYNKIWEVGCMPEALK